MPFSPRSTEVAAVVAILEDDTYEDAREMGKAIVKAVQAELSQRETFAVFPDAGTTGYGPYASAKDAERAWLRQGIGAAYGGHRGRLLTLRPWNAETEHATVPCACGHAKEIHADKGRCAAYGVGLTGPKAKTKPNLPSCPCSGYERSK